MRRRSAWKPSISLRRPLPKDVFDAAVGEAEERLGRVAEAAEQLLREAEREGFEDAARQAESVRQQSLSARNKLKLLREKKS
jgi:hypothetical protein